MSFAVIIFLFFLVAFMYSTVGHGGASGYLALMVMLGFAPTEIRPSALMLNLIVSAFATIQFWKQGYFQIKLFLPLIALSIPMSFIGSGIILPVPVFKILLGTCLLLSVVRILGLGRSHEVPVIRKMTLYLALFIGGTIGLISGMIGIGGGAFPSRQLCEHPGQVLRC